MPHFDPKDLRSPFDIGDRVLFNRDSMSGRYGKVVRKYRSDRITREGGKMVFPVMHVVMYYDPQTGLIKPCPDDRCQGESNTCPICHDNSLAADIRKMTDDEIALYAEEGMLNDLEDADGESQAEAVDESAAT